MSDSITDKVNKGVLSLSPYEPGLPLEQTKQKLGLEKVIKLASNENPLGPSPKALEVLSQIEMNRYPDGNAFYFKEEISKKYNVDINQITVGNGSNDLIEFVSRTFLNDQNSAIYSQHGFAIYPLAIKAAGASAIKTPAKEWGHDLQAIIKLVEKNSKLIFIASPNNPTGTANTLEEIKNFLEQLSRDVFVFLDQAYYEYIEDTKFDIPFSLVKDFPNLIISRSFSKAHGLAALRLGFCVSSAEVADYLNRVRQPFNANAFALEAGRLAMNDIDHIKKSVDINVSGMKKITKALDSLGFEYIKSNANFLSFNAKSDSDKAFDFFLKRGVILRSLKVYEMPQHLRVSIGTEDEVDFFIKSLEIYAKQINS